MMANRHCDTLIMTLSLVHISIYSIVALYSNDLTVYPPVRSGQQKGFVNLTTWMMLLRLQTQASCRPCHSIFVSVLVHFGVWECTELLIRRGIPLCCTGGSLLWEEDHCNFTLVETCLAMQKLSGDRFVFFPSSLCSCYTCMKALVPWCSCFWVWGWGEDFAVLLGILKGQNFTLPPAVRLSVHT